MYQARLAAMGRLIGSRTQHLLFSTMGRTPIPTPVAKAPAASAIKAAAVKPTAVKFAAVTPPPPATANPEKDQEDSSLTKAHLINIIAAEHEITKTKANKIIDLMLTTIMQNIVNGRRVSLGKFGVFNTAMSAERNGRNPQTGEPLLIPPKRRIKFKPSKPFKAMVEAATEDDE